MLTNKCDWEKHMNCYNYLMHKVTHELKNEEFGHAAVNLRNAAQNLEKLQEIRNERMQIEQAKAILSNINPQLNVDEVIRKIGAVYE